jgi:hypothetical protein
MTAIDDRDDASLPVDGPEPVPTPMRFTVISRHGERVHLVCEDDAALYGHPSVCEDVWQAALTEVPPNWEIVDLAPSASEADRSPADSESDTESETYLQDFADRKYELFLAFLGAGFERCEALTLVIETLLGHDD